MKSRLLPDRNQSKKYLVFVRRKNSKITDNEYVGRWLALYIRVGTPLDRADNYMGVTGFVAKGLQIFYPIHPRLMICFYDPMVYDFGKGNKDCSSTDSIERVHQLNGLQLANCKSQLFSDDLISEENVIELCKHFEEYRGTSKNINRIINQGNQKFFLTSSSERYNSQQRLFGRLDIFFRQIPIFRGISNQLSLSLYGFRLLCTASAY